MTNAFANACKALERLLYAWGYHNPQVRTLVLWQLAGSVLASVALLLVTGFGPYGWSFAAGAALASLNFLGLAKFGQHVVHLRKGAVTAQLVWFYGRLTLTGVALYMLLVVAKAPVVGLLAGLSTVLITALAWGVRRFTCRTAVRPCGR